MKIVDFFGSQVDVVLDDRLIIEGFMSPNFDDFAYRVVCVWRGFWALSIKILVFPRPTSYMLTYFHVFFSFLIL